MNFRPIENLTQCPMKKIKDICYALILIDTCSILQDVVCHKVIVRWCHIGVILQGIPDIVSSCNSVSWICVLWRKLVGGGGEERKVSRLVFSWEELSVTWKPGNILLFLENPFSSLYHLVLRLCLRRKGYVLLMKLWELGGPHSYLSTAESSLCTYLPGVSLIGIDFQRGTWKRY